MNSYNLYVKEEMFKLKENTKLTGQERMRIIRENWQKKKREEKERRKKWQKNGMQIPLINPFSFYL
jgi:hypothetical protein